MHLMMQMDKQRYPYDVDIGRNTDTLRCRYMHTCNLIGQQISMSTNSHEQLKKMIFTHTKFTTHTYIHTICKTLYIIQIKSIVKVTLSKSYLDLIFLMQVTLGMRKALVNSFDQFTKTFLMPNGTCIRKIRFKKISFKLPLLHF